MRAGTLRNIANIREMPVTDIVEAICRLAHGNAITNTATEAINVSETSTTITRRREAITRSAVQADLII